MSFAAALVVRVILVGIAGGAGDRSTDCERICDEYADGLTHFAQATPVGETSAAARRFDDTTGAEQFDMPTQARPLSRTNSGSYLDLRLCSPRSTLSITVA